MKISYDWLRQFLHTEKSPEELSLILTDIGLEVESVEEIQTIPGGLLGLVIGEVKTAVQHPNADRLRVTTVNVGGETDLQIVCGAPNVAAGQKVIVATVGCTVYPNTGEPFKINKSKIRGEVSEGMICAEDEIGLGTSHDGIMVLPQDAVIGTPAATFFNVASDFVFEIGLTPNRADAASHLGVARDLAAFLRMPIQMPNVDNFTIHNHSLPIKVTVMDSEKAPRYAGISISGVQIGSSPEWLKNKLAAIGLRPINNVVDVTNYVLHELGQPLHAFDADQIAGAEIHVKTCAEGTLFKTLDGVERKLNAQDVMICDAEKPLCLAGVFGGERSGVTENTKNIFLESAYFHPVSVRKTAKFHGLKTDSSFRFERGTDPNMLITALKRAALLIQEIAGGHISSEIVDVYPNAIPHHAVEVSYDYIQKLIGKRIPTEEIKEIIESLQIQILSENHGVLQLEVPAYKVDVTRPCDITEEVLRIYGYNNIEIPTKINASLSTSVKPDKEVVQHSLAEFLAHNGFQEIWCNSLTKSAWAQPLEEAVQILNPLSRDLDVMRQNLLLPALDIIGYNQKHKNMDLKMFEFGKTYHFIAEKYVEKEQLLLIQTGFNTTENWQEKGKNTTFYHLKSTVDALFERLNIKTFEVKTLEDAQHYHYGLSYLKGEKILAQFGAVKKSTLKNADVEKEVFAAEIDMLYILQAIKKNKIIYKEVSKYPSVRRDLSLLISKEISFEKLKQVALKTDKKILKEVQIFDVYEGDKLPAGKKSYALSFELQDELQTLSEKQIEAVMQKLSSQFEKEFGAEIRKN